MAADEGVRLGHRLAGLTRKQREVLLLAFGEQLTHREIADLLGVRLGTVKSRLNDAKRALERGWSEMEAGS